MENMITRVRYLWVAAGLTVFLVGGCTPRIDNIAPYTGRWGETVVIRGRCLTDGTENPASVSFNGTTADFWPVEQAVEATVPLGATTGPVSVSVVDAGLFGCNAGVAESPADFTVFVDTLSELDSGDDCDSAQLLDADAVAGALSTASDIDCYEVPAGPAGPYGYVLEFHMAVDSELPDGDVRYQIIGQDPEQVLQTLHVGGHDYEEMDLGWTAQAPGRAVYLMVDWAGTTSSAWEPISYELSVARLPIEDEAETEDNSPGGGAVSIAPGMAHAQSRLCSVYGSEGSYGDIRDHFSFELDEPKGVLIALTNAGLPEGDEVDLALLQPGFDPQASATGDARSAGLAVDLPAIWPRPDEFPYFPAGTWYVYVSNQASSFPAAGPGSAPLSCKRPYRLFVEVDD